MLVFCTYDHCPLIIIIIITPLGRVLENPDGSTGQPLLLYPGRNIIVFILAVDEKFWLFVVLSVLFKGLRKTLKY